MLPLPKMMAAVSKKWATWYVRRLNRRLTHVSTLALADWQGRLRAQGLKILATRAFFDRRDGWIWNLLTLQVFRVFGLLKHLHSETLNRFVVRALVALMFAVPMTAESDSEKLGYVLIVAEKARDEPPET